MAPAGATQIPPHLAQQIGQAQPGWRPPAAKRNKWLASSIVILVVGGILATLLTLLSFGSGPAGFLLGILPCTIALGIAVAIYLWLDRWEPEPFQYLIAAFIWGGGIATGFAIIVQIVEALAGLQLDETALAVVQAPIIEELGKGALLFLMVFTIRRKELNSLVDHLVYAGFVGLGFAFFEDLQYFAHARDAVTLTIMIVVRLIGGIFAHPLFTSMTALGIYLARSKSGAARFGLMLGGLLCAMLLHATWNGSASLGLWFFVVYAVIMVPIFVLMARLAVRSRREEGEVVTRQLPGMVNQGLILPIEAAWLGNLTTRKARLQQAKQLAAASGGAAPVARFIDSLTELAFLRDRIDKGERHEAIMAQHQELMNVVAAERAEAVPALRLIANQPLPPTGPVAPVAPQQPGFGQAGFGQPGAPVQPGVPTQPSMAPSFPAPQQAGFQPSAAPAPQPGPFAQPSAAQPSMPQQPQPGAPQHPQPGPWQQGPQA